MTTYKQGKCECFIIYSELLKMFSLMRLLEISIGVSLNIKSNFFNKLFSYALREKCYF